MKPQSSTVLLLPLTLRVLFCFSLSQEQLISTGGVWEACEQVSNLPRGECCKYRAAELGRSVGILFSWNINSFCKGIPAGTMKTEGRMTQKLDWF